MCLEKFIFLFYINLNLESNHDDHLFNLYLFLRIPVVVGAASSLPFYLFSDQTIRLVWGLDRLEIDYTKRRGTAIRLLLIFDLYACRTDDEFSPRTSLSLSRSSYIPPSIKIRISFHLP